MLFNKQKLKRSTKLTEKLGHIMEDNFVSIKKTLFNMESKFNKTGLFDDNKELSDALSEQAYQLDLVMKNNTTITRNLEIIQNKVTNIKLTNMEDSFDTLSVIVS